MKSNLTDEQVYESAKLSAMRTVEILAQRKLKHGPYTADYEAKTVTNGERTYAIIQPTERIGDVQFKEVTA